MGLWNPWATADIIRKGIGKQKNLWEPTDEDIFEPKKHGITLKQLQDNNALVFNADCPFFYMKEYVLGDRSDLTTPSYGSAFAVGVSGSVNWNNVFGSGCR